MPTRTTTTIAAVAVAAVAVPATAAVVSSASADDTPPPASYTVHDARVAAQNARLTARRAAAGPQAAVAAIRAAGHAGPLTMARLAAAKQEALADLYTPQWCRRWARTYMKKAYGWGDGEYQALVTLWNHESEWDFREENPTSGAYGIPQSLPGDKMASAGADWRTNPRTQIRWGLKYIESTYGSPSAAWGFWTGAGWY